MPMQKPRKWNISSSSGLAISHAFAAAVTITESPDPFTGIGRKNESVHIHIDKLPAPLLDNHLSSRLMTSIPKRLAHPKKYHRKLNRGNDSLLTH